MRKQLSSALANGDTIEAESLQTRIEELGGLGGYQQASIQGQSAQRGGDTSKVLVEWLSEFTKHEDVASKKDQKLRLLEVGALRRDNACSRCGLFNVERIDLHSQHPDIKEQDFMARPVPSPAGLDQEGFDVVSLSLVVNFVAEPAEKGEMLRRVGAFLRISRNEDLDIFPALFLVLPAPCVTNSRYLDEERLEKIMRSLGYRMTKWKMSAKLVYYLWRYEGVMEGRQETFKKAEVRTGKSRNNFAIVLR